MVNLDFLLDEGYEPERVEAAQMGMRAIGAASELSAESTDEEIAETFMVYFPQWQNVSAEVKQKVIDQWRRDMLTLDEG